MSKPKDVVINYDGAESSSNIALETPTSSTGKVVLSLIGVTAISTLTVDATLTLSNWVKNAVSDLGGNDDDDAKRKRRK